jgi:RNA polymerase sigma-70 factor, ECF subfamily
MFNKSPLLTYRELASLSDADLVTHLRLGHHDALAVILDRYQRLVWSVAEKIVHDQGEAEDLVQIVFLEFFQKVDLFDAARGTLKVWLLQLAYTRSINRRHHLQRRQFYSQVEVDEENIMRLSPVAASAFRLNSGEAARLIREVLATLNSRQRTAIELISFEGLTFEELANRSGESLANAKHHYYRGMLKLRECLSLPIVQAEPSKERSTSMWEGVQNARAQEI